MRSLDDPSLYSIRARRLNTPQPTALIAKGRFGSDVSHTFKTGIRKCRMQRVSHAFDFRNFLGLSGHKGGPFPFVVRHSFRHILNIQRPTGLGKDGPGRIAWQPIQPTLARERPRTKSASAARSLSPIEVHEQFSRQHRCARPSLVFRLAVYLEGDVHSRTSGRVNLI